MSAWSGRKSYLSDEIENGHVEKITESSLVPLYANFLLTSTHLVKKTCVARFKHGVPGKKDNTPSSARMLHPVVVEK